MSSIRDLVVFKRLQVHQLVVEPRRVKATYTVELPSGEQHSTELIYKYNQVFFDPRSEQDQNLASMMVAQVALNYGLFCEHLEFDGTFGPADKRFLHEMCENTSREIYVNKFLKPNPFLKAPFDALIPEKPERFTAAEISFSGKDFKPKKQVSESEFNPDAYTILSSGGKDSLLTYGLVKELGEAHPVFVNESGRHWFTAVNAYRYFEQNEPNTVKPWCNSDRIFNWMLRLMPFIRENFANIRADIYPIRLWTVPVFLFGVLPVALKRKTGNILIGNEYDTTMVSHHQGILHYDALYDQSRLFDQAMTAYYAKKGWKMRQYSLLRSLSELLILKILVQRYPELQEHQISCHAAHEKDNRMYPCGKCEKCRRIIGMLKANDGDPERCGYTPEQISQGLEALANRSVKQIGTDAAHLYHLLLEKGLVASNTMTKKLAKAHPQIMSLRFDKVRSLSEEVPERIRARLFNIYLEYAEGVVHRQEGKWVAEEEL